MNLRYVEPPVQCCHRWKILAACYGEVQVVDVEVHYVEFAPLLRNDFKHSNMVCEWVDYIRALESQGFLAHRPQFSHGYRVGARIQSYVVALADQPVCQVRHYALGSSIELWRYAFIQRCDLSDLHDSSPTVYLEKNTGLLSPMTLVRV